MRYANGMEVRTKPDAVKCVVEYAKKCDIKRMVEIEQESYHDPWNHASFNTILANKMVMPVIAVKRGRFSQEVCGFAVYRITEECVEILNIAVAQEYRRKWVGTQLIENLKHRVAIHNLKALRISVGEEELQGHLFLKSTGIKAVGTRPGVPVLDVLGPNQVFVNPDGTIIEENKNQQVTYLFEWRPDAYGL